MTEILAEHVQRTFEIPDFRMADLEQRIARLVKTAKKLSVEAPTITWVGEAFRLYVIKMRWPSLPENHPRNTLDGRPEWLLVEQAEGQSFADLVAVYASRTTQIRRYLVIQVSGPAPKLAGWRFLAKLEHTEAGTMIQKMDDAPVPERYRHADASCEHCKLDRQRKDTYIVVNEQGDAKQVGRTCIKDFTGHKSPEQVAAACLYFEQFASCGDFDDDGDGEDEGSRGRRAERYFSLESILAMASMCIREYGWLSKAQAEQLYKPSTGSTVFGFLLKKDSKQPKILEDDVTLAATVTEWGRQIEATPEDDYLWNLSVIANLGVVAFKRVGLAASMVRAYQRAMDLIEKRKADDALPPSEWLGEAGKRYDLTVKVLTETTSDGSYGTTYIYGFVTPGGNRLTWFGSNPLQFNIGRDEYAVGRGDSILIKATVHAKHPHQTYAPKDKHGLPDRAREYKQTVITRVKILKVLEHPALNQPQPEEQPDDALAVA